MAIFYTKEQIDAQAQVVGSRIKTATNPTTLATAIDAVADRNLLTDAERSKLASLESSKFLGSFLSVAEIPTVGAVSGSYADVDTGVGSDTQRYIYDMNDAKFVKATSQLAGETSASIKTKYEANANTNAFTDTLKTKLDGIAAGATTNTGTVTGVTGTSPIVSTGGTAPVISISAATTSVAGSMSASDKTKLDAITGSNTGDETLTTIKTKLGIATLSGANTGDQTTITGNAGTATKLATARTINGVLFDGSAAITINAVDSTARVASSLLGVVNGVATLDASGLIPSVQLPSYVDDVIEATSLGAFPVTGVTGKIYVALDTNKTYRWSGTVYVYITSGAVDSVAGKTGVVSLVKGDVGLGSVDNTTDAAKPVSTAQATALGLKANLASPDLTGVPSAPTAAVNTNTTQLATTAFVGAEIANDAAPIAHVGSSGTAHATVTTATAGFMSAADKTKLDGIIEALGITDYTAALDGALA